MPKIPPLQRLVYLALRHEFMPPERQMKAKRLRERLLKPEASSEVKALIKQYSVDSICQVAKTLLDEGVYHSTLEAKIRFPDVFEVSPAQSAERAASESKAAKSEANAFKLVEDGAGNVGKKSVVGAESPKLRQEVVVASGSKQVGLKATGTTPSLYPAYLPLWAQHRLLNDVQKILEEACYTFGSKNLPGAMDANEWDCAEAVELNIWSKFLSKHKPSILQGEPEGAEKSFEDILNSMTHIRHTAVHRLPITASRVEHLMFDAECLCKLLKDDATFTTIAGLRRKTNSAVEDLKRNKDLLETKMGTTIKDFKKQRKELERLEKAAIAQILAEDRDCQDMAGRSVGLALQMVHSNGQQESSGELDQDVEAERLDQEQIDDAETETKKCKAREHGDQVLQNAEQHDASCT